MSNETWLTWGVPITALLFGAFSFSIAWFSSWNFDRRYGRIQNRRYSTRTQPGAVSRSWGVKRAL
jgi:hypothetical protein